MSQETASAVTEPFEIDLFEFLCVVNEGVCQESNELLHNQHARARHLRATSTSEAEPRTRIERDAACHSNLRADILETTSEVDRDASVGRHSCEDSVHMSSAQEHVVPSEHHPGTQSTELAAPGANSTANGLTGAMQNARNGRILEQNALDTRAAECSSGQEHDEQLRDASEHDLYYKVGGLYGLVLRSHFIYLSPLRSLILT